MAGEPYSELIAKLEAAQRGSGQLDAAIDAALRIGKPDLPEWAHTNFPTWRARADGKVECVHSDGRGGLNWKPHPFTQSIDAALTLVPEFCKITTRPSGAGAGCNGNTTPTTWAEAPTPALALCIAALKAAAAARREER